MSVPPPRPADVASLPQATSTAASASKGNIFWNVIGSNLLKWCLERLLHRRSVRNSSPIRVGRYKCGYRPFASVRDPSNNVSDGERPPARGRGNVCAKEDRKSV